MDTPHEPTLEELLAPDLAALLQRDTHAFEHEYAPPRTLEEILAADFADLHEQVAAKHCNQHQHFPPCPKTDGTAPRHTREHRTPGDTAKVYRLNRHQSVHNQVRDLTRILERASRDGEHLRAVLDRPEFGELTLDCGRPGHKNDPVNSSGHGVKHALEARHNISPHEIAETLLRGTVDSDPKHASRLRIRHNDYVIIIEREMYQKERRNKKREGKIRISKTSAKLLTAMRREKK